MMTSVDNRIDTLISRVKERGAMKAFVFIPGYPAHKTPNPVTKYTVAVTDEEVKVSRWFIGKDKRFRIEEVKLCLRVYAPENSSGAALLRASALLMDEVEACDPEKSIESVSLSGIGFDTASRTEFRDVNVTLRFLSGGASDA